MSAEKGHFWLHCRLQRKCALSFLICSTSSDISPHQHTFDLTTANIHMWLEGAMTNHILCDCICLNYAQHLRKNELTVLFFITHLSCKNCPATEIHLHNCMPKLGNWQNSACWYIKNTEMSKVPYLFTPQYVKLKNLLIFFIVKKKIIIILKNVFFQCCFGHLSL